MRFDDEENDEPHDEQNEEHEDEQNDEPKDEDKGELKYDQTDNHNNGEKEEDEEPKFNAVTDNNEENSKAKTVLQDEVEKFLEEAALLSKLSQPQPEPQQHLEESAQATSNPVASQKDYELDPSYVSFRMYCPVKEASTVVGKQEPKLTI